MSEEYEEFPPIVAWEFHVNSAFPMLGLILTTIYLIHSLYHAKYKKRESKKAKPNQTATKAKYSKSTNISWIIVMTSMSFSYWIYAIEFWWLRIYPATEPFAFCKVLTPFLFLSQSLTQFVILLYFTIRLETAFGGSVLAYKRWKLWLIRSLGLIATMAPTALSLLVTYGVPFSLKSQSVSDKDAWLCRNAVTWSLFWPFLFIFCGVGSMGLNFMNWYMFMNRLQMFVRLRLQSDDSFVTFYSSKHIPGMSKADLSSDISQRSMDLSTATSTTQLSMDYSSPQTPSGRGHYANHSAHHSKQFSQSQTRDNNGSRRTSRIRVSIAKIKKNQEKKKRRKARREKQQLIIYELIKKQSILSGIVAITDALTWLPSIIVDGSTLILLNTMIGLTCVYLSFNFSKPYFDFCCKRFMDNCTCIEDRIEKKLAKEMGLDMNEGNEEEENGMETMDENDNDEDEFKDENDVELQELNANDNNDDERTDNHIKDEKLNRRITEFKPEEHGVIPRQILPSNTNTEIDEDIEDDVEHHIMHGVIDEDNEDDARTETVL